MIILRWELLFYLIQVTRINPQDKNKGLPLLTSLYILNYSLNL